MGLAELQAAVAALSTDPAARALYLSDPVTFALQAALSPDDLQKLHETAPSLMKGFAGSLLHKRTHEAGRAIPLTRTAMGEDFTPTFAAFAATHPIQRDPGKDAALFLSWLRKKAPTTAEIRSIAKYELASMSMRRSDRRFKAGIYRLTDPARRFFAMWWRPKRGQPVRYFQWPRGGA